MTEGVIFLFSIIKKKWKAFKDIDQNQAMKIQWERFQKIGKKKYVWVHGVLLYGLGASTLVFVLDLISGKHVNLTPRELITRFIVQSIFMASIGFFWHRSQWNSTKEQVSLIEAEENREDEKIDFCYYCGAELENDSNICPSCRQKLEL
jgi:hypothetical protein